MLHDKRDQARQLRRNQTKAEYLLWEHLRAKRLDGIKFRRQHSIGLFIVDFCSIEKLLVIEVDGGQHAAQIRADGERTKYLNERGYRLIRFRDNDVLTNI